MKSIFDYADHFLYLKDKLSTKSVAYGSKALFSEALRIKASFLSQVLAKKFCLGLEHADLANQFFEHTADESEFFILLVSRDRSGTESLKNYYTKQINAILKKRQLVVERLGKKTEISDDAKGVYYSSWIYQAVHLGCSLPKINSLAELAAEIKVNPERLLAVVEFLMEQNLISKIENRYKTTDAWIRLDRSSPHISKHHANWRVRAIQSQENSRIEDLFYSGLFTLDAITANQIKDIFLESVKKSIVQIEKAPEESLYQLNLDFFKI